MTKPPGLRLELDREGDLSMRVIHSTPVEDAIWRAIEEAIPAGWTVERFRNECEEAWLEYKRREEEDARKEWRKK